ncbi:MAG: CDP-alcohol phosphatidyltransferase family protein, partial [Clostridia bacterium]|nr:CDP-alcohol phosphatidyltransferase family protein [Clostridia bacterium]
MNTANKITLFRVALIPLFVVVCYMDFAMNNWVALAIFILASISDFLDGYIARTYDQITDFGKFLDPIADKL